jgi:hypothetical protein
MSETRWTPGPWRVDYQTANDPGCERLAVFSAAYIDEEPGVCAGSTAWPLTREDANLIAAAPDLYAARLRGRDDPGGDGADRSGRRDRHQQPGA